MGSNPGHDTWILGRVHKTGRKAEGLLVHERCRGAFVHGASKKDSLLLIGEQSTLP